MWATVSKRYLLAALSRSLGSLWGVVLPLHHRGNWGQSMQRLRQEHVARPSRLPVLFPACVQS